ncbi:uncharacterized protein LOC143615284 isoform X2 [Bidens hawaiensis]|uniref:uncharacterized protein LOC143615284 isoform X2 n=1 Tax=Bidens hawaiensis TaxID=980011 RepID=UPI00404B71ED
MSNNTVVMVELSSDEEADCNWLHHHKPKSLVDSSDDNDCVVLDNDPNEQQLLLHNHNNNINSGDGNDDSGDLLVVSEKGQVACRDYPHSRHLCIKFPFSTTPNQSHCEQCYCYVCDSLAPCVYWGNGTAATDHCHATDKDEFWKLERKTVKNGSKIAQPVTQLTPPPVHIPNPGSRIAQPATQPTPPPVHIPNPGSRIAQPATQPTPPPVHIPNPGSRIAQPVTQPTPPPVHIPNPGSRIAQPATQPTPPPVHIPNPGSRIAQPATQPTPPPVHIPNPGSRIAQPVTQPTPPPVHIPNPGSRIAQPVTQPTPPPVHIPNPGLIHALHNPANLQHPRNNTFTSRKKSHPDSTSQALIRTHQKFNLGSTVNKPVFKRTGAVRVAAPSAVRVAPADAVNVAPTGAVRVARTVAVARRDAARAAQTVAVPQTNAATAARTAAVARTNAARAARTAAVARINAARAARPVAVSQTNVVTDTPTANQNPIRVSFENVNRSLGTVQPNASVNHQQPQVSNHSNFNLFLGATLHQSAPPFPSIPHPMPPQPSYHASGKTVSDLTRNEAQDLKDGGVGQGSTDNASLAGGLAGHQYHWFFDGPPIDPGFGDYLFDSGFTETGPIFDFFDS